MDDGSTYSTIEIKDKKKLESEVTMDHYIPKKPNTPLVNTNQTIPLVVCTQPDQPKWVSPTG